MSLNRYLGFEKNSISGGTDLNNCKTPGTYYIHSSALDSISNKPETWTSTGGILIIDSFSGLNNPTQTVRQSIQTYGGRKYWRNCLDGTTWDSNWHDETYADLDGVLVTTTSGATAIEAGLGDTRYRLQINPSGNVVLYQSTDGGNSWPNTKNVFSFN